LNQSPDVAVMDRTVPCGIRFSTEHVVEAQDRRFNVPPGVFVLPDRSLTTTPAEAEVVGSITDAARRSAISEILRLMTPVIGSPPHQTMR